MDTNSAKAAATAGSAKMASKQKVGETRASLAAQMQANRTTMKALKAQYAKHYSNADKKHALVLVNGQPAGKLGGKWKLVNVKAVKPLVSLCRGASTILDVSGSGTVRHIVKFQAPDFDSSSKKIGESFEAIGKDFYAALRASNPRR